MATISFDENVVITNPDIISMMKNDIEDTSPIVHDLNSKYTIKKAENNGRKWALKLLRSEK
ncbi:MAG: hypothetical protein SO434_03850 [Eubacteriales bacterium]|nr:hypothetical protein [Eubacteriales bacterium]